MKYDVLGLRLEQMFRRGKQVGVRLTLTKYNIACKEAQETQYWLKLIIATKLLSEDNVTGPLGKAHKLRN